MPELEPVAIAGGAVSLSVTEIYASIQGESTRAGCPCTFVRLAGCPLRCRWCDTDYSFDAGARMSAAEILQRVGALGPRLVEVTGGEPLAQRGCVGLLGALCDAGYTVLLETSGALPWRAVDQRVTVIADLKCPDSGEAARNLIQDLKGLRAQDELKVVVASRGDFDWAMDQLAGPLAGLQATVLWSPVWTSCPPSSLAEWILATAAPGRMQLQLHKIIWPEAERGV